MVVVSPSPFPSLLPPFSTQYVLLCVSFLSFLLFPVADCSDHETWVVWRWQEGVCLQGYFRWSGQIPQGELLAVIITRRKGNKLCNFHFLSFILTSLHCTWTGLSGSLCDRSADTPSTGNRNESGWVHALPYQTPQGCKLLPGRITLWHLHFVLHFAAADQCAWWKPGRILICFFVHCYKI